MLGGSDRSAGNVAPLFPRWATTALRLALSLLAAIVVGLPTALLAWERTPYVTGEQAPPAQPVKFDHRHHVRDDGIDCIYCHAEAPRSAVAGVPAVTTCMGCHGQIWSASPELAKVRAAAYEDAPLAWQRVTKLPHFVFFNHSIHVAKGVGCVSCHGRVDQMAQVYPVHSFTMGFCLDCHRAPEASLRPPELVTDMTWQPPTHERTPDFGRALAREHHVAPRTDCTTCHR